MSAPRLRLSFRVDEVLPVADGVVTVVMTVDAAFDLAEGIAEAACVVLPRDQMCDFCGYPAALGNHEH